MNLIVKCDSSHNVQCRIGLDARVYVDLIYMNVYMYVVNSIYMYMHLHVMRSRSRKLVTCEFFLLHTVLID